MDYKEKYENGLECIQEILSGAGDLIRTSTLRKRLQPFFPELQENKDERIRKGLIKAVSGILKGNTLYGTDVTREEAITWLEKQGEPILPKWKYKKDHIPLLKDSLILNKYGCVGKSPSGAIVSDVWVLDYDELAKLPKEELEKQGEQKPADKPNFKIGDFIVNDYCKGKIIELTNDAYLLDTGQGIPFSCEHNIHLWTIEDAKDGDVLACESGWTCIFKALVNDEIFSSHCFMNSKKWFYETGSECHTLKEEFVKSYNGKIYPATKEQRDMLFQKMKEEGYEWDAEKKEVKTIEQKPAESTKDYNDIDPHFGILVEDLMSTDKTESKFKAGNWYQCTKDFFGKGVTFDKNTAYYCAMDGCLQNEYGCHIAIVENLYDNFKLWTIQDAKDGDVLINWNNTTFIFKAIEDGTVKFHIAYNERLNTIATPLTNLSHQGLAEPQFEFHPAAKEQCNTLFAKMKDAGYEWDNEKKELKKIEPKKLDVWNAEDEQNLNVVLSFIPDECLRRWLQDKLCYDTLDADDILPYLGNNQVQDILEDMGMLDDNGHCPHTAEEIFKAGMEHAFNLNREAASSVKIDIKNI